MHPLLNGILNPKRVRLSTKENLPALKNYRTILPLITILALCSIGDLSAQTKVPNLNNFDQSPYHFGFQLGINKMFFTVETKQNFQEVTYVNNSNIDQIPDLTCDTAHLFGVLANPTYGFLIGIVSNLRLGEYFDLRFTPSLTFGERGLTYSIQNSEGSSEPTLDEVTKNIQSTFVDFPIWVRFKGERIHNVRPYVLAGAKYSLDLASNAKKKDNSTATHVFLDKHDVYGEIGVGFDFYNAVFKFGTELRMSYGLFDVLKHDKTIYTGGIENLNSKIFQLVFTFE